MRRRAGPGFRVVRPKARVRVPAPRAATTAIRRASDEDSARARLGNLPKSSTALSHFRNTVYNGRHCERQPPESDGAGRPSTWQLTGRRCALNQPEDQSWLERCDEVNPLEGEVLALVADL